MPVWRLRQRAWWQTAGGVQAGASGGVHLRRRTQGGGWGCSATAAGASDRRQGCAGCTGSRGCPSPRVGTCGRTHAASVEHVPRWSSPASPCVQHVAASPAHLPTPAVSAAVRSVGIRHTGVGCPSHASQSDVPAQPHTKRLVRRNSPRMGCTRAGRGSRCERPLGHLCRLRAGGWGVGTSLSCVLWPPGC